MNIPQRWALTAGASLTALVLSWPAHAATQPGVEDQHAAPNVSDTLTISSIGDPKHVYGVTASGGSAETAEVFATEFGLIEQSAVATGTTAHSGNVKLLAKNAGSVAIQAQASATAATAAATARAGIGPALTQAGNGKGNISLTLANQGTLDFLASAGAKGQTASATALLANGIWQLAHGKNAAASLANSGNITLAANAAASATLGSAKASAHGVGLAQNGFGILSAGTNFSNSGLYSVSLGSKAQSTADSLARADLTSGMFQIAAARLGDAAVGLDNKGQIAIDAAAAALGGGSATAFAHIGQAATQLAIGPKAATASIANSGKITAQASAAATATTVFGHAHATASANGLAQVAAATNHSSSSFVGTNSASYAYSVFPTGRASSSFTNAGVLDIGAKSVAKGQDGATAIAAVGGGGQVALGTPASVSFVNSGNVTIDALATATASHGAEALAYVAPFTQQAIGHRSTYAAHQTSGGLIYQYHESLGVGVANVGFINQGSVSVLAEAHDHATATMPLVAHGFTGFDAYVVGVQQSGSGSHVDVMFDNQGSFDVRGLAQATALDRSNGIDQAVGLVQGGVAAGNISLWTLTASGGLVSGQSTSFLTGPVSVSFRNEGVFSVAAALDVKAASMHVGATATDAVQYARGSEARLNFDNSGTLNAAVSGNFAGDNNVSVSLHARGIAQDATQHGELVGYTPPRVITQVTNSGAMNITASGVAHSDGTGSEIAQIWGIIQQPVATSDAEAIVSNTGSIKVAAEADITAGSLAAVGVEAIGVAQVPEVGDLHSTMTNSGQISVTAVGNSSTSGRSPDFGLALATDLFVEAGLIEAKLSNSGTLSATALANANGFGGFAAAGARGIKLEAITGIASSAVAGPLSGILSNSGTIRVATKVDASNGSTRSVTATGIFELSADDTMKVTNSGLIAVEAVSGHGGPAASYGILVAGKDTAPGSNPGTFTFTNDGGTILARQSTDGGKTWQRGMAIDVSAAPNASVINLLDGGAISGNIAIQGGDSINVRAGQTYFDGVINPGSIPFGGLTAADLDSGLAGVGSLNISQGGNLIFSNGAAGSSSGPSYAYVDRFAVASDGSVTFQLQPTAGGLQRVGSYAQLFANNANLSGGLVAQITTANGLFADRYSWNNVIDANALTGSFAKCALGGPNAGSLLLKFSCSYDAGANVDLALARLSFGAVGGLGVNALAAAAGLDAVYQPSLTGQSAKMFADLFRMTNSANYNVALNQLAGSPYANFLNAFPSLGVRVNDVIDRASSCNASFRRESVLDCRSDQRIHLWSEVDGETRNAKADAVAGATKASRYSQFVGIDAKVGEDALVGVEGGHLTNDVRDSQFGDSIKSSGFEGGIYATYDPGPFYVKAETSFGSLKGRSARRINFAGLGPNTSFEAALTGHPDVTMWTAGLHAGARFALGSNALVTPYLAIDHVQAKLASFGEAGANGDGAAALNVEGGKDTNTFATAGVKWATHIGGIVPEFDLSYQYRFGGARSSFAAQFGGAAPGAGTFDISSTAQQKGAIVAGLSLGGKLGPVDLRLGYRGEFNGNVTSHSASFKIVLPLGGHRAGAVSH